MNVRETDSVAPELRRIASYLENERRGTGLRFFDAYDIILDTIRRFPQFYPVVEDEVPPHEIRNAIFDRLDYRAIYIVRPDEVVILAVTHTSRRPRHWHHRLDEL